MKQCKIGEKQKTISKIRKTNSQKCLNRTKMGNKKFTMLFCVKQIRIVLLSLINLYLFTKTMQKKTRALLMRRMSFQVNFKKIYQHFIKKYFTDCLTAKDINDINWCQNNDIDHICISNVKSANDIKSVRNILGNSSQI